MNLESALQAVDAITPGDKGLAGILGGVALVVTAIGTIVNGRRTKKVYNATNGVGPQVPPLTERMARLEGEMSAHRNETIRRFDRLEDAIQDVLSHVHRRDQSHVGD